MSARLFYKAKTLYLCWSGMKRGFTEIEVRGSKYIYSLIKHKYITNLRESKINEISIEIANFRGLGGELSSLIAKKYFFYYLQLYQDDDGDRQWGQQGRDLLHARHRGQRHQPSQWGAHLGMLLNISARGPISRIKLLVPPL